MPKYSPEETYEIHENDTYAKGKMTPKQWFENVWYHYKWVIIVSVLLVAFITIALFQLLQNEDPDIKIMYVGPMYISPTDVENIETAVTPFGSDCTGDGKVCLNLLDITINEFSSQDGETVVYFEQNKEAHTRFQTEIRVGDSMIYILEEPFFDECVELGILAKINDVIDDAYMPENLVSDYGVRVSELESFSLSGLSSFPENAVLCLRRSPDQDELSYGRSKELWECNRQVFVKLVTYSEISDSKIDD